MPKIRTALAGAFVFAASACAVGPAATPANSQGPTMASPFSSPIYPFNFPDPMIVRIAGGYMAIATNGNGMNVQTLRSDDLTQWSQGVDALPSVARWSSPGKVWAPEIIAWQGGGFRLYYTTKAPDAAWQCISVATSAKVAGPFRDDSSKPLVCEIEEGGSIDASPFVDSSGKAWLYWKNDGNAIGADTWIKVAPLSDDGLALAGPSVNLFKQDLPWEGRLVEGPAVVEVDGVFHMFYSANDYGSAAYALGHAVAPSPQGPWRKDAEPVLKSNDRAAGPGHCQLFRDGDQWLMVYHAWAPGAVGDEAAGRQMWLSRVTIRGEAVTVTQPGES